MINKAKFVHRGNHLIILYCNLICFLTLKLRLLVQEKIIDRDERVVCILTGHQLKDPTATVSYHTTDQDQFDKVLGSRGVQRASYANRAVIVPNDADEIVKVIQLYS